MNAWPFIIGAYAFTFLGTSGLLLLSWRSMRLAEAHADLLKREP